MKTRLRWTCLSLIQTVVIRLAQEEEKWLLIKDVKKRKTTNAIYLTDRQGLPLAMSEPMKGNHNDVYEIDRSMTEIFSTVESAGISVDGIFNNADAGFDCADFRAVCERFGVIANVCENLKYSHEDVSICFDDALYKERYVIERSNAWMDSFRTLLLCHDTTASSWKGWNYLAFAVLFLKKFTIHKSLNEFYLK